MAPSRHDWKIVDWDVKPQHNQQPTNPPKPLEEWIRKNIYSGIKVSSKQQTEANPN